MCVCVCVNLLAVTLNELQMRNEYHTFLTLSFAKHGKSCCTKIISGAEGTTQTKTPKRGSCGVDIESVLHSLRKNAGGKVLGRGNERTERVTWKEGRNRNVSLLVAGGVRLREDGARQMEERNGASLSHETQPRLPGHKPVISRCPIGQIRIRSKDLWVYGDNGTVEAAPSLDSSLYVHLSPRDHGPAPTQARGERSHVIKGRPLIGPANEWPPIALSS